MKTDELIALLAKDAPRADTSAIPMRTLAVALVGGLIAFAVMTPWLGLRRDLATAVSGPSFWMKAAYAFGLCLAGFLIVGRLSRPGGKDRFGTLIASASIIAIAGVSGVEISQTSPQGMRAVLMGSTWHLCFWRILVLALPTLVLELLIMRRFAPTRPALAGAGAGLLAGGLAALVYGLHCDEHAAPMVAIWYSLGVALSTLVGALAGPRLLRW